METLKNYTIKNNLEQISIEHFMEKLPELKNISESKASAIGKWLINTIERGIKKGTIETGKLLPSKADFAYRLGVSIGTVQNALKYVEDNGHIEAKPCIGTIIRDKNQPSMFGKKSTSKRDIIISQIKNYIKENNFKEGDNISSSKHIAQILNHPVNTVRLALENLCTQGILKHNFKNSDEQTGWFLVHTNFYTEEKLPDRETMVEKVVKDLKTYITQNHRIGDRIKSHAEFSQMLQASMSTIHTAFKILTDEGILMTRRGQYGTVIMKMPSEKSTLNMPKETSIFAPAAEAAVYYYEKTQSHIKKIIAQNYSVGDKLPPISEFAQELNLSPNTIRKAFLNLAKEGYLTSSRGRYGGTYVIDIPETETQNFKWLAVNPKYAEVLSEN